MISDSKLRFAFVSSNIVPWGGSEELWAAAAAALADRGHRIAVFKGSIDKAEPRIKALQTYGCRITDLASVPFVPWQLSTRLAHATYPLSIPLHAIRLSLNLSLSRRPDLVILSQGGNSEGLWHGVVCRRLKLPYVLLIQKASDLHWPFDSRRNALRRNYCDARWCYFVSDHNRRLTEQQLATELSRSSVVRNPFLVSWPVRHDWPDESRGFRLACIGRLNPMEKGQDMLLRVLARDKWRQRALSVSFFGAGIQRRGLEDMAAYLNLKSVSFRGFVSDVAAVWKQHHGLVLPSRCEGLPLVAVEAMMSGRVPILTDVGGARELVDDEVSGFVADAPTEDSLDDAMERAWQRRDQWRAIGHTAMDHVCKLVPPDPAQAFADTLVHVAQDAHGLRNHTQQGFQADAETECDTAVDSR